MSVSFVSSASAASNTITMPAHQSGDLLILRAVGIGFANQVGAPDGWYYADSFFENGPNRWGAYTLFKVATSSSESIGTLVNCSAILVMVYRGANTFSIASDALLSNPGAAYINYPTNTIQDLQSWVVRIGSHRTATNQGTNVLSGYTSRNSIATNLIGMDTNGAVSVAPTAQQQSVNATAEYYGATIVINTAPKISQFVDAFDGSSLNSAVWLSGNTITVTGGSAVLSSGAYMQNLQNFDLNDNRVIIDSTMAPAPADGQGSTIFVGVIADIETYSAGQLYCGLYSDMGGTLTSTKVTYNSTTMRYISVRNSGLTNYIETSADGKNWTIQHSTTITTDAKANLTFANLEIVNNTLSGTYVVNGINVIPGGGNFFSFF